MSTIVVGVDGSPQSEAALDWAMAEARLRGATVRAVHAWSLPYHQGEIGHMAGELIHDPLAQFAQETLDAAVRTAASQHAVPVIEGQVVQAPAARALIEAAADADLLVVGSRGRGGFTGLLLGSVSQQCAQGAMCPVVIVRYGEDAEHESPA